MTTKPYHFECDYVDENDEIVSASVEFYPGTVRSNMEARRIVQKLLRAYGYIEIPAPDDEFDNMDEFAAAMARTKVNAPWCINSNMPEETIREAYELFLLQPESVWTAFRIAVRATVPPKKTITKTPET